MQIKLIICCDVSAVYADVYLHNPRGSNNRLDGENRERRNDDRLFDSQNNDRGGYNVGGNKKRINRVEAYDGGMTYYAGSTLRVEWTNQHSCGGPNNNCEIILQYMCSDLIRDGTTTSIIPDQNRRCRNRNCNLDREYGMHETLSSFQEECKYTERNKGLFTADQDLKGDSSIYTRQNPNGKRRGLECPEERDYYPYWGDSPWKDIAIMTNDVSRCGYYKAESQNVKSRYKCVPTDRRYGELMARNRVPRKDRVLVPITKEGCEVRLTRVIIRLFTNSNK